jgi:hypothetical protein
MNLYIVLGAYAVSLLGGGVIAGAWVDFLRRGIDSNYDRKKSRLRRLDWSIGLVERTICTTLVIWAPVMVPGFVGGWIALKFAANWQTRKDGDERVLARQRMGFLIGSAASMAIAICAGVFAHPSALKAWSN